MHKVLKIPQMKKVRPENILIDTGFWIALYNERDAYHETANEIMEVVQDTTLLIPWPSLYETVNTRLSKNKNGIINFETLIKRPNTILLDDSEYKENALDYSMENSTKSIRPISLVDSIIREVLSDVSLKIDYLITFNVNDFIDVCAVRKIDVLNEI